jgi:hypothetical protein
MVNEAQINRAQTSSLILRANFFMRIHRTRSCVHLRFIRSPSIGAVRGERGSADTRRARKRLMRSEAAS